MQWRAGVAVGLSVLLLLGGFVGPALATPAADTASPPIDLAEPVAASTNETPTDPESDVIGWENGYWHNESIDVDQSDGGLSDAELEAYVSRSMARVEYLREMEFESMVDVEVISREDYREQTENETEGEAYTAWNNQVWEALFIVGDNEDVQEELDATFGTSVVGFYSPEDDEIKIVTETPESPVLNNGTLIHELVHALQDQHYNISQERYQGTSQDTQLSTSGLIEGEANYIQSQYADRCGDDWECVESPGGSSGGGGGQPNLGILLTIFNPYSDGPVYIESLFAEGGWEAVDDAYADPPASSEQIIHQSDDEPTPIEYEDAARNGWSLFADQGINGSDTVGEASIYAMLWYQASVYGADTIDPNSLVQGLEGDLDTYGYESEPSMGWGNDRVFPYVEENDGEPRYGYVWLTEWDSVDDAEEFRAAYQAILDAHGAEQVGERTWVIHDGPFADAFRVVHDGTRVTIVNGPTTDTLEDIHPPLEHRPLETPTPTPTQTADPGTVNSPTPDEPVSPTTTADGQSGFGFVVVAAALGLLLLSRRRRV